MTKRERRLTFDPSFHSVFVPLVEPGMVQIQCEDRREPDRKTYLTMTQDDARRLAAHLRHLTQT